MFSRVGCRCVSVCISEMASCEGICVFVKRPNKTVISAYNAFKCE